MGRTVPSGIESFKTVRTASFPKHLPCTERALCLDNIFLSPNDADRHVYKPTLMWHLPKTQNRSLMDDGIQTGHRSDRTHKCTRCTWTRTRCSSTRSRISRNPHHLGWLGCKCRRSNPWYLRLISLRPGTFYFFKSALCLQGEHGSPETMFRGYRSAWTKA